uniref:Uncharacterized protein MANES_18G050600 n=1 Tax=Rhizophora mucronata TaxID=61149 RepID=A0A2P2JCE6_RHIMU
MISKLLNKNTSLRKVERWPYR